MSSTAPLSESVVVGPSSAAGLPRSPAKPYKLRALAGYIGGKWVPAKSGRTIAVTNPADGSVLAVVPDMGAEDTRAAIEAAEAAFPAWAAKTAFERAAIVRRMQQLLVENAEGLGVLLSLETGKPLEEAKGEVKYAADFFEWYSEEGKRAYGEVLPPMRADRRMLVLQQPVGPCAALTPWNFPAAMPARKVAPALAAGCPVVLRPSINTPLSAIAMVQIAEEAGVPPGVFNLVLGEDHVGTAGVLCSAPEIRKLSFTGSTPVGRQLMAQCSGTLKRLSLELGGRAPFIVFEDAGALLERPALPRRQD
jgi:succinate-semialdehyde dehydrogenase / glutarate-semialdehyde dehydrogenase